MEFSIQDRNQGRKMTGVVFVVLLHIGLVWALMNGLGRHLLFVLPKPPIDVTLLVDAKPAEPLPPQKPLDVKPVKIDFVPPVVIPVDVQPDPVTVIKKTTAVEPEHTDGGITRHEGDGNISDVRVPPVVDAKACEKPEYPDNALRNGETGITGLQFLIGVDGRVLESKVAHSSGSRELDRAALAGLTRCAFKAGTVNGKPVASWTNINYEWRLE